MTDIEVKDKPKPTRILIVDDNISIHDDFRMVLGCPLEDPTLDQEIAFLFGDEERDHAPRQPKSTRLELSFATQGQQALQLVEDAIRNQCPFSMAFVDMRMPPGWDGLVTIEHLWQVDPSLQIVICTAYSDYSWNEILNRLGHSDNLLILKKPFESVEVAQMTAALTTKWEATREAEQVMSNLRDLVDQHTQTLQELLDKANLDSKVKSELGASVSSAVLNPTRKIYDATALLSQLCTAGQQEVLERIWASSDALTTVGNTFLDVSELETGRTQLKLRKFDLKALLRTFLDVVSRSAAKRGCELECRADEAPDIIVGDVNRFRQILSNLTCVVVQSIGVGRVTIELLTSIDNDTRKLDITIHGKKSDRLPNAEVILERTLNTSWNNSELAVGVAKRLIKIMGGEMKSSQEHQSQSYFSFSLPLIHPRGIKTPTIGLPALSLQGLRVLLVEDDLVDQQILASALGCAGCQLDLAETGNSAVYLTSSTAYDVILMDCLMPVKNGFEATLEIRQTEQGQERRSTIIGMMAEITEAIRARCLDVGMDACLVKPIDPSELLSTLQLLRRD